MPTPLMNLDLPTVGPSGTQGPDWATKLNSALTLIDSHDHTSGKGGPIPTVGLNINADLAFSGFNITGINSSRYQNLGSALVATADKNCVYVVGGELFFNDSAGTAVQLTSAGGINLTSIGAIGGDYSTSSASLNYSDTTKTFTFKRDASVTADIAAGSISIFENVASGKFVKLKTVTGLVADYDLTLPTALPASTLPIASTSGGVLSFSQVTQSMLAARATGSTVAAGGFAKSSSSGSFSTTSTTFVDVTNLTITITTTGRPVQLWLESAAVGTSLSGTMRITVAGGGTSAQARLKLVRDGSNDVVSFDFGQSSTGASSTIVFPASSAKFTDFVEAGTYTYKIQVLGAGDSVTDNTIDIVDCVLMAKES